MLMGSDDSAGLYYPVGAKARRTFQVDQEKGEIVQEKTESADATLHWDTLCWLAAEILCNQQQWRQSGWVTSEWVARGSFPEKGCPLAKTGIVRGQPGCVPRDYTLTSCLVCVNSQRSDRKKKYLWHWDDTLEGLTTLFSEPHLHTALHQSPIPGSIYFQLQNINVFPSRCFL